MSNVNGRDDNGNPILWGVSHVDGVTPVKVRFTADRFIMIDSTTTIQFDPSVDANVVPNNVTLAKATASDNAAWATANQTTRPWVVNATTGAVLVDV